MSKREWIAEIPIRGMKTVIVHADTRTEAVQILRDPSASFDDIEDIDCQLHRAGRGRVIREHKTD